MKIAIIILAVVGLAGAAYAVVKGTSSGPVAAAMTPVATPTSGTAIASPAPTNQTGVTPIPLDAATTQIAAAGRKRKKKK